MVAYERRGTPRRGSNTMGVRPGARDVLPDRWAPQARLRCGALVAEALVMALGVIHIHNLNTHHITV